MVITVEKDAKGGEGREKEKGAYSSDIGGESIADTLLICSGVGIVRAAGIIEHT